VSRDIANQTVSASEARQKLGQLMKQVFNRESRVIVEKGGIPVVAMVSIADFKRWTRLDREREERFKIIDEIRARNADREPEEVERDVAEEIASMKGETRSQGAVKPLMIAVLLDTMSRGPSSGKASGGWSGSSTQNARPGHPIALHCRKRPRYFRAREVELWLARCRGGPADGRSEHARSVGRRSRPGPRRSPCAPVPHP
jgi:prevent-host-death family protein